MAMAYLAGGLAFFIIAVIVTLCDWNARICPYCAHSLPEETTYCPFCNVEWMSEEVDK